MESPNQKDSRLIKDKAGKVIGTERVYVYEEGQRTLWIEFQKPVKDGGCALAYDATGELQLHRTTFETLLPSNLKRMNNTHKAMCSCSICQNTEYKFQAAQAQRRRKRDWYDHKVHVTYPPNHRMHDEFKQRQTDYIKEAFPGPDGEPRWATKEEAYQSMTCPSVDPDRPWWVPYKCQMGLCENCPSLHQCPGEDKKENLLAFDRVTYKENCSVYTCPKHGNCGTQSKCVGCIHDDIPKKNRPKLHSKASVVYKTASVGDFYGDIFPKQLRKYSNHCFEKNELTKNGMVGQRFDNGLSVPGNGNVIIRRDYTSRFPMEYNNLPMSNGLSGFPTVGMEGFCVWYVPEGADERVLVWMGCLSDEKQQDARTSLVNSIQIADHLEAAGVIHPDTEETIFEISDGCVKQYKSANSVFANMIRCNKLCVPINHMVTCPQHGKNLVDGLAGRDKSHCSCKLIKGWDSATLREDGTVVSQARVVYECLAHPDREFGAKGDTKHPRASDRKKPLKDGKKEQERVSKNLYWLMEFNDDNPIPFKNATFTIDPTHFGTGPKMGISQMFQFYYHPNMDGWKCAIRRMPCYCLACKTQMEIPWDIDKPTEDQGRFELNEECHYYPVMGELNAWVFPEVDLANYLAGCDQAKEEVNIIMQQMMDAHIEKVRPDVVPNRYGAIACQNKKFWLVQWRTKPYQLKKARVVTGQAGEPLPKGSWVCDAYDLEDVKYGPGWYERRSLQNTKTYNMAHVLMADVPVEKYDKSKGMVPPKQGELREARMAKLWTVFVPEESRKEIKIMYVRTCKWDLLIMNDEEEEVEDPVDPPEEYPAMYAPGLRDLTEIEAESDDEDDN